MATGDVVKWLVSWRVADVEWREKFVYEYNARQWVHVVRLICGVKATVQAVMS